MSFLALMLNLKKSNIRVTEIYNLQYFVFYRFITVNIFYYIFFHTLFDCVGTGSIFRIVCVNSSNVNEIERYRKISTCNTLDEGIKWYIRMNELFCQRI